MNLKPRLKQVMQSVMGKESKLFLYTYHRIYKRPTFPSVGHLVHLFAKEKQQKGVSFIQIGANEGTTEDVLYYYILSQNWKGILVEPQAEEFKKLKENYASNNQLIFENVAIVEDPKDAPDLYYVVKEAGIPEWVSKLSSFDRSLPEQVLETYPKARIERKKVEGITFETLLERNNLDQVDLLMTDTEGYDYQILKQVDWKKVRPEFVIFESRHLNPEDDKVLTRTLANEGYAMYRTDLDTVAFKSAAIKEAYGNHLLKV